MLSFDRREQQGIVALLDEATLLQLLAAVRETGQPILLRYGPTQIQGNKVRISTDAPSAIAVDRDELFTPKHGIILLPFSELGKKQQ